MTRQHNYRHKLFFSYAMIVFVVVFVFSCLILLVFKAFYDQSVIFDQERAAAQCVDAVHEKLEIMQRTATQCASNGEIVNRFAELKNDANVGNHFQNNVLEHIRMTSLLTSYTVGSAPYMRVCAYNWRNDYVSNEMPYESAEAIARHMNAYTYADANVLLNDTHEGLPIEFFASDPLDTSDSQPVMSFSYPIANAYKTEVYGVVSAYQSVRVLQEILLSEMATRYEIGLRDGDGAIIAANDPAAPTAALAFAEKKRDSDSTHLPLPDTNWTLSLLLRAEPYWAGLAKTGALIMLISIAILSMLLIVVRIMANTISKPLSCFCDMLKGIGPGAQPDSLEFTQTTARFPLMYTTEMITLRTTFNDMLRRLNEAQQLEMQAYMHSLQAQMNPHFLYNTLAVISVSCQEQAYDRIVSICNQLTCMLRYSSTYEHELVSIQSELDYALNYLNLMKIRYEDSFSYTLEMPENIPHIVIPKLSVQPIVENCFKHGFASIAAPWTIHIHLRVEKDSWRLSVEDNGAGIPADRVSWLKEQFERLKRDHGDRRHFDHASGLGLTNTLMRMYAIAPDSFVFDIRSEQTGTTVMIGGGLNDSRAGY